MRVPYFRQLPDQVPCAYFKEDAKSLLPRQTRCALHGYSGSWGCWQSVPDVDCDNDGVAEVDDDDADGDGDVC